MLLNKGIRHDNVDTEIIFELRWKSDNELTINMDKTNIMGILDTPETCKDWPTFKSYLVMLSLF